MSNPKLHLLVQTVVLYVLLLCFIPVVHSEVPDDIVYTDPLKTVRIGDSVVLTCQFRGEPLAVYWKKGDDPRTAPNLVSWIPTDEVTGLCEGERPCQIMEMNENRSLVIKEVSIAEEGRYICRVSSYKGILIHSFTDIKLFSTPQDPFPVIHQCAEREPSASQSCSIPTSTPINITCMASKYYPDLDLFFLHGHNKITDLVTNERTNHDGTKNRSISIKGSASEIPYQCVASDIPGTEEQRVATVLLVLPAVSTSVASDGLSSPSITTFGTDVTTYTGKAVKIVVSMVILVIIALVGVTFVLWKRHQRRGSPEKRNVGEDIAMLEEVKVEGMSEHSDVYETMPMVQKMKVEGVVSFYELWLLAYDTPKEDMGKVCSALIKLGIIGMEGQMRREQMYDALCDWKETVNALRQTQMFRDALEAVKLGTRWIQIYDKRREATTNISEETLEQILLDLEKPEKIHNFLYKLIPDADIMVDTHAEKDNIDSHTALISNANTEGKKGSVSDTDIKTDIVEEKEGVYLKAVKKFREWNKGPFNQNSFVLVSLALEKAGYSQVSKTFFEGTVSFYELRSLLYDMDTPGLEKVRKTLCELGQMEEVQGLGPQELYDALCGWKQRHNRADQAKVLRDALERADFEEAWLQILEQRKTNSGVSDGTLKQILLDIKDPGKIHEFLSKLVPGSARNLKTSAKTDVIQQAMETLREWNKGPFDENPMVLLSYALERAGCNPVDKTFVYGTMSYFELWSMAHVNLEDGVDTITLRQALLGLGIHINDTTTLEQLYLLLCKWKDEHPTYDQLLVLKVYLIEAGLNNVWQDILDRRTGTDRTLSEDMLEHIMWLLKDPNKINTFLQKLSQNNIKTGLDDSKPVKDNIRAALVELEEWMKQPFDKHPVVLLSLALENAQCSPVDKTFFNVPALLQKPIHPQEVESFVIKLTSRHCKRLTKELPNVDEKRISDIQDENNKMLFDTQSLICDWIANEECCNYEKRCKLDGVVIDIGRYDMTDYFGTIEFRRKTEDLSKKPHPMSKHFNHETIFDDDLIRLKKLMDYLDLDMMSEFCMKIGLPDHIRGANMQSPSDPQLRQWRNSHLTSTPKEVFSEITELIGDKTCVKHVTDGELDILASLVKDDDKKDKLLSALNIDGDKKRWKWKRKSRRTSTQGKTQVSDGPDDKIEHADEESTSREKQEEETLNVHDEKDEQVELTLVDLLKVWRNKHRNKSCRKKLRAALKSIGIEECIVNRTPRKIYKAELIRVAFNVLMRDVYPVGEALGIDQKKFRRYRRRVPLLDKGSLGLFLQLCEGKTRKEFCLILTKLGYIDVARSTYLDYEQSACELTRIASRLEKAKLQSLIDQLGLSPDALTQCRGTDGEVDGLEALRVWKNLIRPEPYHFRLHIVYGLQAIGFRGLADEVLRGHYRQAEAEDDVIKGICSRLDDSQIKDLCGLLKLKPDEDRMRSITAVISWLNKWMQKYDPHPTTVKTTDRFHQRKRKNDELVEAGFYELAHEIMILEYSIFKNI